MVSLSPTVFADDIGPVKQMVLTVIGFLVVS